jgi:hypothetical protein
MITGQISGTTNGIGVYSVNNSQNIVSEAITGTYGTMTVTPNSLGHAIGQPGAGWIASVTAGTQITQLGTGVGLTGTYFVSVNAVVASTTISAAGAAVAVAFDSISGGYIIASGVIAANSLTSTIGYASGTTADPLNLRQADGAVNSQGSAATTPSAFMGSLTATTQDWATLMTLFDPDNGNAGANAQKLLFSAWTNSTNDEFMYVAWDTDITPTVTLPASASMGQLLDASNTSGTFLHWAPDTTQGPTKAAFICGMVASIDFTQHNGRITLAFKSQTGLFADVTNQTVAHNLGGVPQSIGNFGNFYNFYGAYATANDLFVWENRGMVSGPFEWADSYVNQIWLNNALQLALMELLGACTRSPTTPQGYALIEAACLDPINAAVNFGAIRAGITLSQAQIQEINTAAGVDVATTIQQRGWYLQISDAAPQTRAARASPPCTLWYTDGQSVQAITLASIEVQ